MENFEEILKREIGVLTKSFNEFKEEMYDFKHEMYDFRTETRNDIREIKDSLFVIEHEQGRKIDAMYDKIMLNEEITKREIKGIKRRVEANEFKIMRNSLEIDSLKKSSHLNS